MVGIGRTLKILQMTTDARRIGQSVVVVEVTIRARARWHRVHAAKRESSRVVVERRVRPVAGVMALITGLRKVRGDVVGIGRALRILQMATDARRVTDRIVVVSVAIGTSTRWYRVHSTERETGAGVVKCGVRPVAGVMALITGLREVRGDVVGIGRALVILQVAAHTSRVGDRVVIVNVAIRTLPRRYRMQSGQRKVSEIVVERCIRPTAGVVALIAGLRKTRCDVVGIGRTLEILQMAGHAGGAVQSVIVIDVAIGALPGRNRVQTGQHKTGGRVIKLGIAPLHRIVAVFARRGKTAMWHRSGRACEVFLVASNARQRAQGVIVVYVTVGALPGRDRVTAG